VVSDIRLPGRDGLSLQRDLHALDPELPVVLITGHGDVSMAVQAMKDGAYDFMQKPFAPEQLVDIARRALEKRRLVLEVRACAASSTSATARSPADRQLAGMARVRGLIGALADSAADVLIHGETGTGKELVARCLHDASPRARGNFVAINCGGLPETLFDSEIFGHEAGAYTGAGKRRIGKIEHASGGTLFLDEIESMPVPMQIKLLRVLQERTLERLGEHADSGRLPRDRRDQGRPARPLRTGAFPRRPLLPAVRRHAATAAAARAARGHSAALRALPAAGRRPPRAPVPPTPPGRIQQLVGYAWPGNVRELRNVADRCVLGIEAGSPPFGLAAADSARPLNESVEAFERALIADALRRHGSLARTAEALAIAKTTLHDKIRKYGLGEGSPA
jgi:two-component system C4-dicarboxylate transport response regulator DctD